MIKLYESEKCLAVDTERDGVAFPIYVFYKDKLDRVNYLNPTPNIILESNEERAMLRAIILQGRQNNKYIDEIEYYTKLQAQNEEDLSKMPNPVPKDDQEVKDIFEANIDTAKKHLEKLRFLQEAPIDSVVDSIEVVL